MGASVVRCDRLMTYEGESWPLTHPARPGYLTSACSHPCHHPVGLLLLCLTPACHHPVGLLVLEPPLWMPRPALLAANVLHGERPRRC